MTDRPIIFSGPMVRALLDDRKTQTRRLVKVPGIMGGRYPIFPPEDALELEEGEFSRGSFHYRSTGALSGPYRLPAQVGDRLYVREHWRVSSAQDALAPRDLPTGLTVEFAADGSGYLGGKHRQGMHMPRWASRLTLFVEAVKVEPLQAISRDDAIAEGIARIGGGVLRWENWSGAEGQSATSPQVAYALLWNSLHAAPVDWNGNPQVVALTFRVERGNIDQIARAA